ncbi:MAG TPA: hypothetical protein PKA58_34990 [Polyangium sp.]|nr:hypothetical protein [Polyangium sp.]
MNRQWMYGACSSLAASIVVFVFVEACERHADVRQEVDDAVIDHAPSVEAGPIPLVDAGLEGDAFPVCAERPVGDCVGSNDFLCGFEKWMKATAESCQMMTNCQTNGWLEVRMAENGCVSEIRMEHPNDAIMECLLAQYGNFRCPCGEIESSHYFGSLNTGICLKP